MFNLTGTKFELWVEMFLQIVFSFLLYNIGSVPDVRITSSSATTDQYGISFRVQVQTFRHSP